MDATTIALTILVAGIPIVIALLMLFYPVATLMIGGVLVTYLGGLVAMATSSVTVSSAGPIGGLVGGMGIVMGIGLIVFGFIMIGVGGILAAVIRVRKQDVPVPDLPEDHLKAPVADRW